MIPLLAAVLVLLGAQDPPDPAGNRRARSLRVRSDVRIIVEESPEGDYEHDYYEQESPVAFRSGKAGLSTSLWYLTVCRPQEDDRAPLFLSPPPAAFPLSVSVAVGAPHLSVTAPNALFVPGQPRIDPIITKPAIFGAGGGGASASTTSTDTPVLAGPDFDFVVASDLSGWGATRWMPGETSLHLYARALFGSMEVFDTPTSLQLYGIGPRLAVPLARPGSFDLALTVSAGPAFLHTGIGDAVGFDGGIGLRAEQSFSRSVSFVVSVEANLYFSDNVSAFGPVFNLGFNVAW